MAWRYNLPKCPVSPADRGEYMKPSSPHNEFNPEREYPGSYGAASMTPAQDATPLADELAQISGRCSYERDRETIIKAVAALRATPQTPDAVRKAVAELVANRDGNTLVTGNRGINIADHDKEKYSKFADRILTLVGRGAVIGWQDIETAPHETRVLLGWIYDGAWFCETGMASHGWRRNGISNMSRHGQATHWQPLPVGPAK